MGRRDLTCFVVTDGGGRVPSSFFSFFSHKLLGEGLSLSWLPDNAVACV